MGAQPTVTKSEATGAERPKSPAAADERRRELIRIRRRGFWFHVLVYVVINAIVVQRNWAAGGKGFFFWPIFLMVAWGAGVIYHGYFAYLRQPAGDENSSPGTVSTQG